MPEIGLRAVADQDVEALFQMMREPESVRMAAFTPDDPDDRARFEARASSDNVGSPRALQKAGFRPVGTEVSFAAARQTKIEETILRLDGQSA